MDAGGQAQDRAAMRHVGETEAAVAIGVDRRAPRKVRFADDDAVAHGPAQALAPAGLDTALPSSSLPNISGRSRNRISIGPAMNSDE
jgi:hypothetical protein